MDDFLMQNDETIHLQSQIKNMIHSLNLKEQQNQDLSKKNQQLTDDVQYPNILAKFPQYELQGVKGCHR